MPNENKILYFDCDILIYKDLTKLYNYNIEGKYYTWRYEGSPLKQYGSNLNDFINSGVLIINLKNLRKDNSFQKIYNFLKENIKSLTYLDQYPINVVNNKKNGFFPSYYVSSGVCDGNTLKNLNEKKDNNLIKIKNLKEPYIFHFKIYSKPWHGIANNNGTVCFDFFHRFYEYERKKQMKY